MNFIPGDPGKSDLLTFIKEIPQENSTKKSFIKHTFTQTQRDKDVKNKKYNCIRMEQKEEKINNETINQIENKLSKYNHKTCDLIDFLLYISKKNEINKLLIQHYKKNIYRKLKLNTIINTRRSEDNMINGFKNKMGTPENTIVVLGDYSDKGLKGTKSTITVKWRKIFKRHQYTVYLINEFNTSIISNCCGDHGGYANNFVEAKHKNNQKKKAMKETYEKKSGKKILVWKLVRCTICKSIHNRDSNASKNMLKIIKSLNEKKGRPIIYCPKKEESKNKIEKCTPDSTKTNRNKGKT